MATVIFCGDSCAWAPVFTKLGGLFARPLRSNRTGQSNRIALIQKSAVPRKAQVEDPSDLTQRILLHWFPGSFRLVQADRTAGGIENPWVCPLPRRGSLVSFPQFSNITTWSKAWLTWPKRGRPLKHLNTRCIHHDAILLCWNLCIALFHYPVVRKGQLWAMCLSNINQYSLFCMSEDLQSQFPNTWWYDTCWRNRWCFLFWIRSDPMPNFRFPLRLEVESQRFVDKTGMYLHLH